MGAEEPVSSHLKHPADEVGGPGGAAAEAVDGLPHGLEGRRRVDLRPADANPICGARSCCAFGLGAHVEHGEISSSVDGARTTDCPWAVGCGSAEEGDVGGRESCWFLRESSPASETLTAPPKSRCPLPTFFFLDRPAPQSTTHAPASIPHSFS